MRWFRCSPVSGSSNLLQIGHCEAFPASWRRNRHASEFCRGCAAARGRAQPCDPGTARSVFARTLSTGSSSTTRIRPQRRSVRLRRRIQDCRHRYSSHTGEPRQLLSAGRAYRPPALAQKGVPQASCWLPSADWHASARGLALPARLGLALPTHLVSRVCHVHLPHACSCAGCAVSAAPPGRFPEHASSTQRLGDLPRNGTLRKASDPTGVEQRNNEEAPEETCHAAPNEMTQMSPVPVQMRQGSAQPRRRCASARAMCRVQSWRRCARGTRQLNMGHADLLYFGSGSKRPRSRACHRRLAGRDHKTRRQRRRQPRPSSAVRGA